MKITVNALGDPCPIPVVKTKKAIQELNGQAGVAETLVDNEIAVQNLSKLAKSKGYPVSSEKINDKEYRVTIEVLSEKEGGELREEAKEDTCIPDGRKKQVVVVISSLYMGEGEPELGAALMKSYIYALAQQDELPSTILLYNGGVKLACEESPALQDLKSLEAMGVEILACGTCLNFYGITEKLQAGTVTNMYVIAEKMSQANLIIKP